MGVGTTTLVSLARIGRGVTLSAGAVGVNTTPFIRLVGNGGAAFDAGAVRIDFSPFFFPRAGQKAPELSPERPELRDEAGSALGVDTRRNSSGGWGRKDRGKHED